MKTLEMTEQKAERLSEIEDLAIDVIKDALNGVNDADDEQVKVAVKTVSMVAKNRQTLTNRAAIDFGMARMTSDDKELKKYVDSTNPQIRKAIAGKV